MKTIPFLLAIIVTAFVSGCASHKPEATKLNDPHLQAPEAQSESHTEVHGYISTTIGGRIK